MPPTGRSQLITETVAVRSGARALLALAVAALLAVLAPAASAAVSGGHSGWSWSDPSPQGEDVEDMVFAGSTGYAVGDFGTLLRSADGGTSWTGLPSTTTRDLTRVTAIGTSGFVTSGGCAVRRSLDGGAMVGTVDVGGGDLGCGTEVQAAGFADASNGLMMFANGVVLGTADGGVTLSRRTPVPGVPGDLVVVSPTTAFATSGTTIYRTTDAAGSWTVVGQTVQPTPFLPAPALHSITFASPAVGYAVGDRGTVLKSTDGGASWTTIGGPGGGAVNLLRVRCVDAQLCLFTTSAGSTIARTADGGATYTQVAIAGVSVRALAFASPTRAVAAGQGGLVVVSDDGGATWQRVGSGIGASLTTIAARPGGVAYTVGANTIALTSDGGERWRSFGVPTALTITTAAFLDALTGYAQDSGGTLRRTLDGGATWQVLDAGPGTGRLQEIVPLRGGRVLLVTAAGIARSADGGETFALVTDPDVRRSPVVRSGVRSTSGRGIRAFVVARRGLLRSSDGGRRWQRAPLPRLRGRTPTIAAGDCAPPGTCWVLTTGSRVYRTVSFGRRWVEVTASVGIPRRNVIGVAAGGAGEAFLALRNTPSQGEPLGMVLHTSDGGRSWAPQVVGRAPLAAIDAVPGRAWTLSSLSQVFSTTTGGSADIATALSIRASARTIRRATTVTIRGRLPGASGGEQIVLHATGFASRTLTVATSGSFTARYRLTRTTTFVAQWPGDGRRSGDGTPPLVVRRRG